MASLAVMCIFRDASFSNSTVSRATGRQRLRGRRVTLVTVATGGGSMQFKYSTSHANLLNNRCRFHKKGTVMVSESGSSCCAEWMTAKTKYNSEWIYPMSSFINYRLSFLTSNPLGCISWQAGWRWSTVIWAPGASSLPVPNVK